MPIINLSGQDQRYLGSYPDYATMVAANPNPTLGDFAIVDGEPAEIWIWSEDPAPGWDNAGAAGGVLTVFGRTGVVVAEKGDYNADKITDNNVYAAQSTLAGGTTTGMDALNLDGYVDTTLAELAADVHDHPNLANIDTINQDLATTDDVLFASLNLTQALGVSVSPTPAVESDFITLTESTSGRTVTLGHISDFDGGAGISPGYPVMRSSSRFDIYTNDTDLVLRLDGIDASVGGDLWVGELQASGVTTQLRLLSKQGVTARQVVHDIDPVTQVYTVEAVNITEIHDTDNFYLTDLTDGVGIPGDYRLYVECSTGSTQAAGFNSNVPAGVTVDLLVDNATTVIEIGSRLAVGGAGNKLEGMILASDDLYITGTDNIYMQDTAIIIDGANGRVGVGGFPGLHFHVFGNGRFAGSDAYIDLATEGVSNQARITTQNYANGTAIAHYRYNGTPGGLLPLAASDVIFSENAFGTYDTGGSANGGGYVVRTVGAWSVSNHAVEYVYNITKPGEVLVTTDVLSIRGDGIKLLTGARVDTIETVLTDDDTHLPTSGAVYDTIAALSFLALPDTPGAYVADSVVHTNGAGTALTQTAGFTFDGAKLATPDLKVSNLNTGDEVLSTDTNGDVQESGVKVTTAPAGGSGFTLSEYAADPVNPPAGFLWIQNVAGLRKLRFFDGATYHFVDM